MIAHPMYVLAFGYYVQVLNTYCNLKIIFSLKFLRTCALQPNSIIFILLDSKLTVYYVS